MHIGVVLLRQEKLLIFPTVSGLVGCKLLGTLSKDNVILDHKYNHRINNQPEVRLRVGTFDVGVLAHVASRISSSPSIRHLASSPGSFYRRLFLHIGPDKYKTSAKRQPS